MKNWKTTMLGILTLVATLATVAVNYLKTGAMPDVPSTLIALGSAWGLIWAHDPKPTGTSSNILPALALCGVMSLSGCAWYQAHKTQIIAVSEVALQHIAKDVLKVAASALVDQAQSGFNGDWADSLTQGAYALTPNVISSGNLQDYLDAWNPAAPAVNAAIAKSVSDALPADQVNAALQDPTKAKALASQVGVTIGNAVLAANAKAQP